MELRLLPLSPADVEFWFGKVLPFTGVGAWLGDEMVGIGGVGWDEAGTPWAVVDGPARLRPIEMSRWAQTVLRCVVASGEPWVYAMVDESIPGAARFLQHVGFRPHKITDDGEVLIWPSPRS